MRPFILAFAVVPSLAAAPVPRDADRPVLYFPTTVGTKWVYRTGEAEETLVVTAVEEAAWAKVVTVAEVAADGRRYSYERVAVSAKGLFRVEARGRANDSPVCLLRLPAAPGDRWDFRPAGASDGLRGSCVVHQWDRLVLPAGAYLTLRVDAEYTHGGPAERTTFWYAQEVGLVKQAHGPGPDRVLTSFRPGKD